MTDFGLAKRLESSVEAIRSGVIFGTLAYMSPEQSAGNTKSVTTAADLYGLGAILYQLLTLQAPFVGANPAAIFCGQRTARRCATQPGGRRPHRRCRWQRRELACFDSAQESRNGCLSSPRRSEDRA